MKNNIFTWGVLYFLQCMGTAMGTSASVMWVTLYYGYHENNCLIPKYGNNMLYFKRFVDDICGIWLLDDTSAWSDFCDDVNDFGVLTWKINEPSYSVDFLDLTISINNGKLETKTFQKALNLYLYLPPASAHPDGVITGTIYGLVGRYYAQNTHRKNYISVVTLLFQRLLARGWEESIIKPIILKACAKIEAKNNNPTGDKEVATAPEDDGLRKQVFIHIQHHPDDIKTRDIQQLYEEHCGPLFRKEMDTLRPIVAYSRPRNIGDYITSAQFKEAPGKDAAFYMGKYKQGLAP